MMQRIKNIVLLLPMLMIALSAAGQLRVPDEEDVLARTIDQNSKWYYPELMMRYVGGDTTLTVEDYHYLYYGYAYDANYRPLDNIPDNSEVLELLRGVGEQGATRSQAQLLLEAAKDVMLVDPFSPSNINVMTFAYGILGDTLNERISADRFNKIVATIEASGTGLKENSPMHVLRHEHVNDLLLSKGLHIVNRTVRSTKVEYVQVQRNGRNAKGYFFNFERIYWKRPEMIPEREKSNWMINGIPLNKKR
ncbi:MAG: DUF4919 domain-containing protein [Rikenellaceae bacterium]|nr:DUF4919 domain-containing protein [Rikenellaceae bacterium]